MNGDPGGFAVASAVLNAQLARAGTFRAARVDVAQSGTVAAWTLRDGTVRLLAGNPEEGRRNDADRARTLDLALPASWRRCVLPPHGSTLLSRPR